MKKLANLKGAKALNREQQKAIFGGDDFTHAPNEGGGGGPVCYVTCNDGHTIGSLANCDSAPDLICSARGGWTFCSCGG